MVEIVELWTALLFVTAEEDRPLRISYPGVTHFFEAHRAFYLRIRVIPYRIGI